MFRKKDIDFLASLNDPAKLEKRISTLRVTRRSYTIVAVATGRPKRNAFKDSNLSAPKSAKQASPGQRPGNVRVNHQCPERAIQSGSHRIVPPFQGSRFLWIAKNPGRCPGLACFRPLAWEHLLSESSKALGESRDSPNCGGLSFPGTPILRTPFHLTNEARRKRPPAQPGRVIWIGTTTRS